MARWMDALGSFEGLTTSLLLGIVSAGGVSACSAQRPESNGPEEGNSSLSGDVDPGIEGDENAELPFHCESSKAPIFQEQGVVDLRISADFTKLNSAERAEESGSPATITIDGESTPLTMNLVGRGKSRFHNCAMRPFALKFEKKEEGTKKDKGLFKGLGSSVKFVTHCGYRDGAEPFYKAANKDDYEQRVIMEHTIYQVLDQLGVPSLKTRLVRVEYHDTQTGMTDENRHFAFVREPEDTMAKRCGAVELEASSALPENEQAYLLLHLLNGFVIQTDWSVPYGRNVVGLVDSSEREVFYAPYDFDLTGVFRPDYSRNAGRSLAENEALFRDWLRRSQNPTLHRLVDMMLEEDRPSRMRAAVAQGPLNDPNRSTFSDWIDRYIRVLEDFRACEGHAKDPSKPACYVSDDHGNEPETATPMQTSVAARIEPPTDVDMLSFLVEADKLYTFGGAHVELLDEEHSLLATSPSGGASSLRIRRSGTVFLRNTLGTRLVSYVPYRDPTASQSVVFMYADDNEASLESAIRLEAGKPFHGQWEPSVTSGTLPDQDWFRIRVQGQPSLHVIVDNPDANGLVEVRPLAVENVENLAYHY